MKQMIAAAGLLFGLALLLTACGPQEPQKTISKELGIDVSQGTVAIDFDSHGGFHGDGVACAALQFPMQGRWSKLKKAVSGGSFPWRKPCRLWYME